MKSSRIGLCVALLAVALAPLGCESSSSSSGGPVAPDSGVFTTPDGGDVDPPVKSECVAPTKGPTTHQSVNADETWTADGSPHILIYDTTIYKTVTVEPCAEILIADGKQVTIRGEGKLIAEGTATKRIHIGAKDAAKPFANIRTLSPSIARFAYTTIDGGGVVGATLPVYAGTLMFAGDGSKPTQDTLFVDHVTIAGSLSNGIVLTENAGFAQGSNALVIKGSAVHPLSLLPRTVGTIPVGAYTGNGIDQILLPTTDGTITETTTLHERGVPYLVGHQATGGDIRVDTQPNKPGATLTIEPGVMMRFKKGGIFHISFFSSTSPAHGSLIAVGTPDKPIVFTSDAATPAAGDWLGLHFGEVPTAIDKLDYVRVEYAGGTSSSGSGSCPDNSEGNNDAAIRISGWPGSQFITNTTILGSLTNGIDRGWRDDREKIDFLPTIKFTDVALCNETYPPNAANVCPQPASAVPCPKTP